MPGYWIDTDPGVDDAVALLLAIRDAGSGILGMSSVQGNVGEVHAARNLARILGAARACGLAPADWTPLVARGSPTALATDALRPDDFAGSSYHGKDGLGDVAWPTPSGCSNAGLSAAESIVATARERPGFSLVCLGPLTNVALALRLAPELPQLTHSILIMGGSLRAGGNETIAAEFNFAADPEAARLVFDAGFKDVALVPIDACDDTRLMWGDYQRLRRLTSPIARLISELLAGWDEAYFAMNGVGFYDPTAWLLGAEPSLAEWERVYVTVDTGGGPARGASVADWRRRTGRQPNARVATSVPKRDVFYEQFFQRLS